MDDQMGNAEMRSAIQPLALQIMFTCFGAALLARFCMRERSRPAEAEEDRRAEVTDVSNVRREIMAIHLKHIIDGVAFLDVLFTLNSIDYTRFLQQPHDVEWTALETPTGTGIPSSGLSFRVREAQPHGTWWELLASNGIVTYRTLVPPALLDSALNQGSPGLHLLLESASRALNWEGRFVVEGGDAHYRSVSQMTMETTRFDDHGNKSRKCLHELITSEQPGFPHIALRWLAEGGLRMMVEHCNADHWPHDLLTEQLALLLINAFFPRIRDATIEMGLDEQFRDALPTIIQKIIHLMATETSRPPGIDLVRPRRTALYALRVIVGDEASRGLGQAPRYVTVFGAGQFALVEPLLEGIVQLLLTDPGDELTCTRLIEIIRIISHESQDIVDRSRGVIDNVLQGTTATAIGERFNLGDVEVLNLLGDFCNSNVLSEAHGIALQRVEAEQEAEQGRMARNPFSGNQAWWDGLRITELEEEWLTELARRESPVTHDFICPISNEIMRSPCTLQVTGDLSHVYDEDELAQHLRASIARDNMTPPRDPRSNQALEVQGDPPYAEAQIFGFVRFNDPLQRMISTWVNIRLNERRANNFQAPPQADDELADELD